MSDKCRMRWRAGVYSTSRLLYVDDKCEAIIHYNWKRSKVARVLGEKGYKYVDLPLPMEDIADVEDAKRFVAAYVALTREGQ